MRHFFQNNRISALAFIIGCAIIASTHFFYYPKWDKTGTEATISWDVSGYYMYLPALLIYEDLKHCAFKDDILSKYKPTPDFQQAFFYEKSHTYVMKYSIGQSFIYAPFFIIAHTWASLDSKFLADGFSFPYQFCISMGTLLIAFWGLMMLRQVLLEYFEDSVSAITLLILVIGTNYLNYSAIDGAMTHNSLFTLYSALILLSLNYYKTPNWKFALGIGFCVGLSALIRPTEIISFLIPVLWGTNLFDNQEIGHRLTFFKGHYKNLLLAGLTVLTIGSIQLFYWKYATGDWVVYSYQDQGFSWLSPHIKNGLFSYKSGWLVYTPLMFIALIGWLPLYQKSKHLFTSTLLFSVLFIYIAFSWDIWWYGGSLGQRTMVQAYPILAIPMAAFLSQLLKSSRIIIALASIVILVFISVNVWFTHHAHRGRLFHTEQMTKQFYWKTIFRPNSSSETLKLLDHVKEIYNGILKNKYTAYSDPNYRQVLDEKNQNSYRVKIPSEQIPESDWIRVLSDVSIQDKEWNFYRMTQLQIVFRNGEKIISDHMMRLQRHLNQGETKKLFLDIRSPDEEYAHLEINYWNANSHKPCSILNLFVETFDEN